ncbi:MAG TPA: hypothetical protein VGE11_16460 [Pseudonocardia sp.]
MAKAHEDDAHELRRAAARLRQLLPLFEETPGTEFVPMSVAALLEAIAESVGRGKPVRDSVLQRALEIARHVPNAPAKD